MATAELPSQSLVISWGSSLGVGWVSFWSFVACLFAAGSWLLLLTASWFCLLSSRELVFWWSEWVMNPWPRQMGLPCLWSSGINPYPVKFSLFSDHHFCRMQGKIALVSSCTLLVMFSYFLYYLRGKYPRHASPLGFSKLSTNLTWDYFWRARFCTSRM